jgi:GlpG protein
MRLIGHLPTESGAARFSDLLFAEGIGHQVEADAEGWAVWIHAEEQLDQGRTLLGHYRQNPDDPAVEKRLRQAKLLRKQALVQERKQQESAEKRTFDRGQLFRDGLNYRPGWLTWVLIAVSLVVTISINLEGGRGWERLLLISARFGGFLPEVRSGEIWRLLTPIFLHGGVLHLAFNMICLLDLGGMVESRQSARRLAWLVVGLGVASNVGQYLLSGPAFGGMSGVIYGLLGYIWMRGKFDPTSGLFLHPQTVVIMLVWFFLCFTPLLPNIANGAHAVGLVGGLVWGWTSALLARRRP